VARDPYTDVESATLALEALAYLGRSEDLLGVFLRSTGLAAVDLPRRLDDRELLASVLDFLLMDDAWVREFAEQAGVAPSDVLRARRRLPGGDVPDWT
jgi:hypothetical protein